MSGFGADQQRDPVSGPPISAADFRCARCGYDLSGTPVGGRCPECGVEVAQSLRTSTEKGRTSPKAKTCMIMGILALVVLGPIAIGYYFAAKKELSMGKYSDASRSMAKAGLAMGIIASMLSAFWIVVLIADA